MEIPVQAVGGFTPILLDLAIVLATAAVIAFIFQRLKQPVVMGYLLAGALIGPVSPLKNLNFATIKFDLPSVHFWADLGIIFLMFSLGLEFSFRKLFKSGLSALWIGAFEITFLFIVGSAAAKALLPGLVNPAYLGAMIAISSTTIIVKAFEERKAAVREISETIYALLIVEDLAAVLMLVILTSSAEGRELNGSHLMYLMTELVVVIGGWYLIGTFLLPKLLTFFEQTKKRELMTLFAIGICLLVSIAAASQGYSLALGAFITGSIIAETALAKEVEHLVTPLKDIFGAVFFVSVGMLVDFSQIGSHIGMILGLSALVIGGKTFAIAIGFLTSGRHVDKAIRAGLSMGQIGEFSFIIAALGMSLGKVSPEFQPVIVAVSVLTSFLTPYSIRFSPWVAARAGQIMPVVLRSFGKSYRARLRGIRDANFISGTARRAGVRFLMNAILVSLCFGFLRRHFVPFLADGVLHSRPICAMWLGLALAMLLSAPLLFAMVSCGGKRRMYFTIATLSWLSFLTSHYINLWMSAVLISGLGAIVLGFFRENLEATYARLETHFLAGFLKTTDEIAQFMTWNKHWKTQLTTLILHPNSQLAGSSVEACGLRTEYGLTLVAIQRGERMIAVPDKDERLYPYDELQVLGFAPDVEKARALIEASALAFPTSSFEMRSFRLSNSSEWVSQSIRETQASEDNGEWIVGVERSGEKLLSPPPDYRLSEGDVVWIISRKFQNFANAY